MDSFGFSRILQLSAAKQSGKSNGSDRSLEYAKLAITSIGYVVSIYVVYKTGLYMNQILGMKEVEKDFIEIKKDLAKRLDRPDIEVMSMNAYEAKLASCVIASSEITEGFHDIGGMDGELETVMENIVYPIQMHLFYRNESSSCIKCPTGVLLYGRPGTGKTLTAKAIAKETGVTFLNIKSSHLFEKYIGESEKVVTAMFSLARKLAPSVIFIDEIDTILFNRNNSSSHASYSSTLGLFLSEWDGLTSTPNSAPVIILGATNRPQDIDEAFRRRMPVSIETKAPNLEGRVEILTKMLEKEILDPTVSIHEVAMRTEGYTGSDLRELCRSANTVRAKEVINNFKEFQKQQNLHPDATKKHFPTAVRPLSMTDFHTALNRLKTAETVIDEFENASKPNSALSIPDLMKMMDSFYRNQNNNNNEGDE